MRDFKWTAQVPAKSRKARKNAVRTLRLEWYVPTSDESYEWSPAHTGPDGEPELHVHVGILPNGEIRIGVWGDDDFGLDKDFVPDTNLGEVIREAVNLPRPLSKQWLYDHGYTYT